MSANGQLLFLNFSNPSHDARQRNLRKQVRSWVTKKQHSSRRDRDGKNNDRYVRSNGLRSPDEDLSLAKFYQRAHEAVASACIAAADSHRQPVELSWRMSYLHRDEKLQRRRNKNEIKEVTDVQEITTSTQHSEPTPEDNVDVSITLYEESLRLRYSLEDPTDDLNKMCKLFGQSMTDSLQILTNLIQALGPDLEAKMNITPGLTAKHMLPMVLCNPALLAATTLKCVTMICHLLDQTPNTIALLELRQYALSHIRSAIQDPSGEIPDELLCAVSTLANYELVYHGNRELYHAHKEGLVKMIKLRGGLEALGNEGYTQSTLVYNDLHTAKMAGCRPHLSVFMKVDGEVDEVFWLQGVRMVDGEGGEPGEGFVVREDVEREAE